MAASTIRFIALGWVDEFYVVPTFHFTWELFPWVLPLPGWLMHLHFAALAVLALAVALGFHYRVCMPLFCAGFTYVELIDKTTYLNHYYLVSLLSALLVAVPAHSVWSVDARRRPEPANRTVPAWTVSLLRFQIGVVYVFAGLAKLNADWLLDAQPMRIWLAARSDLPLIGPFFTQAWIAYAFSWFGAAYDLTIVFFLLWGRTRFLAYVKVILFHVMTALLFPIGMFPWIMIVATLIFFPPDWPRRAAKLRVDQPSDPERTVREPSLPASSARPRSMDIAAGAWSTNTTAALLAVYAAIQIAVPLRAYLPGADPEWTGRGFNFAWRVMLIEKAGHTELIAGDRSTGRHWPVRMRDYVTERQEKMMAQDPFMVRALARHIASDLRARGVAGVEVRADSFAALNGRPVQRLIDPRVDFAGQAPPDWIVPLNRDAAAPADEDPSRKPHD
jgi:vitamin K-dependent gamma-carboxylase